MVPEYRCDPRSGVEISIERDEPTLDLVDPDVLASLMVEDMHNDRNSDDSGPGGERHSCRGRRFQGPPVLPVDAVGLGQHKVMIHRSACTLCIRHVVNSNTK
jgi:hypothetical protein